MKSRGLLVPDEAKAAHHLRFIGYYRLAGYALPLQVNYNEDGSHRFLDGTTFDDVLDLYVFDRKLRLSVIGVSERIEVAVRAIISQEMSERCDPHWFIDPAHFHHAFGHARFIEVVKKDICHDPAKAGSRQTYIQHYYDKYGEPDLPPSWMVFEALSFGTVSMVFKNLLREHQKPIAKAFGLDGGVLASWIHAISYLRNLAAHHQRLWNRPYTIKPKVAKLYATDLSDPTRFYAQAVIIEVLLKVVAHETGWPARLARLFDEHPNVPIRRLGFPADWRDRPLWAGAV